VARYVRSLFSSRAELLNKVHGKAPTSANTQDKALPKLGILGGVFNDGSVSLFSVPDPSALRQRLKKGGDEELFGALFSF
jgi:hypothetical protein